MAIKSKVPQIRFKGFSKDWEEKKFSDISESFEYGLNASATKYDGKNKYIRITDINENSRVFDINNLTSPDTDLKLAENYKLTLGDILFARTGASVGKTYIYKEKDGLVYYAGFLIRAKIKQEVNANFIFQNTLTNKYNKFIRLTSQRSGQPGVNAQEYSNYKIYIPEGKEQTKIGNYFQHLDKLIEKKEKKYQKLKQFKKAMLDKMFPKNGADTPEIRFKGFSGEWEETKLNDLIEFIVDNRGKNPRYYCTEGIPIIDNFMIKNNRYPTLNEATRFIDENLFDNFIRKYNELNDILITLVGNGIGNITLFPKEKSVIIQNTLGLRFSNEKIFMFYCLLSKNREIKHLDRGMAQPSIRQDELLDIDIRIPKHIIEQTKIGNYFQKLDRQIELQLQEIEKLKNIKKASLAKMFV